MELITTRMLIIDKGKKVVEGRAEELFDPSQTVVELETGDAALAGRVLQETRWAAAMSGQHGAIFYLKLSRSEIPALNFDLAQRGVPVLAIRPRHSLEDYFLSLTTANQHVQAFTN